MKCWIVNGALFLDAVSADEYSFRHGIRFVKMREWKRSENGVWETSMEWLDDGRRMRTSPE